MQGDIMNKENKFIDWMNKSFAPKLQKVCANQYVSSVQEAIIGVLPMIMIGSVITIISVLKGFSILSWLPDLSLISQCIDEIHRLLILCIMR
jgi:PTS system cellobiose-specific IIC component